VTVAKRTLQEALTMEHESHIRKLIKERLVEYGLGGLVD